MLILLGLLYLIIEKRNTIFYIILIAVISAASYLKIYPLTGRIILYLIPLFIMFIIKSADNPVFIKKIPLIIFNVLKVFLLFIILFCIFEIKFDEKFNYYKIINMSVDERNNIKNVTVDIFNNCSDNDKFLFNYIYYDSFNFYKKMYKFNKTVDWEVEIYINSKEQWEKSFTDFFNNQSLNYKYWITFENSYDDKEKIYAKDFFKQKLKEKNITFKEFHYGLYYALQLNSIN